MNSGGNSAELVKGAVPLSRYIAQFAESELKPNGPNKWRTACPLHGGDNKTGFTINDQIGLWKCFTGECGGGSIIDFWQIRNDNDDFGAAVEGLAGELQVELPKRESRRPSKRRIWDALEDVALAAHELIFDKEHEEANTAREYMGSRKVKKGIARRWKIGFIPSGREAIEFIKEATDDLDALVEAKFINRDESGSYWVPMNGRVVFPIWNDKDKIVGFGARQVPEIAHSMSGKWVNSSESIVYDKSATLYGMQHVSNETENIILVEGYLDVIAFNEANGNRPDTVAVAACGTSISQGHLRTLGHARTITEVFDPDMAGKKALVKSLWSANHLGNRVNAVLLKGENDPWDMFINGEADKMVRIPKDGLPLMTMAVQAQSEILDYNTYDITEWVKSVAAQLDYSVHKDQLINDAARVVGQSPTTYKRSLALPTDISVKHAEKHSLDSMSPHTRSLCVALLSMEADDRDGVLASLRPWSNRVESLVSNWMPVSTETDIKVLQKITLGIDSPSDGRIDKVVASLMEEDSDVDIRVILRGYAKQLLSAISSLSSVDDYLASQIKNIRKTLDVSKAIQYHPTILAYLMDISADLERAMREESQPIRSKRLGT